MGRFIKNQKLSSKRRIVKKVMRVMISFMKVHLENKTGR
jgi:hypothetical protein